MTLFIFFKPNLRVNFNTTFVQRIPRDRVGGRADKHGNMRFVSYFSTFVSVARGGD